MKEPVAREGARSGAASGPEPGREDSQGGNGAPPPPPVPGAANPPKAPTIGTTTGGDHSYRAPGAPPTTTRSSSAFLDDPSPHDALPCEIDQDHNVLRSDLPDPDAPVGAAAALAVLAALRYELRMRAYPPRAATMPPDDQAAAVLPPVRPKPLHLHGDHLAAMRRQAGIQHTAHANA
jgi:hypothetical protein